MERETAEPFPRTMIFHLLDLQEVIRQAKISTEGPTLYGVQVKPSPYMPRGVVAVCDKDGKLIKVINLRGMNEEVVAPNEAISEAAWKAEYLGTFPDADPES